MDKDTLRLAFVGDVCLSFFRHTPHDLSSFSSWRAIREDIGEHDLLVGNLECCFVDERCSKHAEPWTAVSASAAGFLRDIGFSDLCLANNHIMDCGSDALPVTRAALTSHGMRGFGAGSDLCDAEAVRYVDCKGRKLAFVGACDKSASYATSRSSGTAPLEKRRLGRRVREAARNADLVVVVLHADLEFSDVPGRWRQRLSRWLIDQGAHMIIQHHPHVLQGIETHRQGIIAYSLGNFIFRVHGNPYQERQSGVFNSMVLVVDAHFGGSAPRLTFRTIPLRIGEDFLPHKVPVVQLGDTARQIGHLSSLLVDGRLLRRSWRRRCRTEARQHAWGFYYACRDGHPIRGLAALGRLFSCREERRWLLGFITWGYR